MLEDKDIQKLIEAQREVFATKEEFSGFKDEILNRFSELQTSVDAYAKRAETIFQEMLMLTQRVNRLEKWIKQLAEHTKVKLEE